MTSTTCVPPATLRQPTTLGPYLGVFILIIVVLAPTLTVVGVPAPGAATAAVSAAGAAVTALRRLTQPGDTD